jgi:SAM-dependent methyltransferase
VTSRQSTIASATRFDDRADDYVRYRPTYPRAAIDATLDGLGSPASLRAADLGAGTGISARLLAERGVRVTAIEPSSGMRAAAAPHPRVNFLASRAEATGIRTGAVDLVLSAQSFHWFASDDTLRECARILKPSGRLAIVWNRRSRTDPLTVAYRDALLSAGAEAGLEQTTFDPGMVARSGHFAPARRVTFSNEQRLDRDGLVGRARSASYCPKDGPEAERLEARLHEIWRQYADSEGLVALVYETELYTSAPVAR